MEDVSDEGSLRHRRNHSNSHKKPHNDNNTSHKGMTVEPRNDSSSGSDSQSEMSTSKLFSARDQKMSEFLLEGKLGDITNEANMAFEQLHEKFAIEYKALLHNVASSASRTNSADGRIPDRVNFSFSSKSEQRLTKKRFTTRDSVLTDLLKIVHIRTVYNIFAAILIIFSVQTVVYDLFELGRINIDFELISWGFGKFPQVLTMWFYMQVAALAIYPGFTIWVQNRQINPGLVDRAFLLGYILYLASFLCLPVYGLFEDDIPPISSVVVTMEQIRMLMKVHSFVRENVPRVRSDKPESMSGINFSRYIYFLFAPTLIYRDEYPRTHSINWSQVVFDVFQLIICIFYTYYIFIRFCVPVFHNFNSDHVSLKAFVISVFGCMLPGTLILLIGFFAVLHCWLNAWAEMLTFGDRMFYKDWWNSVSFSGYYRNWNLVVHDWLFSYVYQDTFMLFNFKRQYRFVAMYATFFISAIFHEYIITASFHFFYPVLFVCFGGFGVCFIFVTPKTFDRSNNIFLWVCLFIGNGINLCLYSMEWYARSNCAPTMDSYMDYVIPRSWNCAAATGNMMSDAAIELP